MGQGIVREDCESLSINWHSRISKRKDLYEKYTKNNFFFDVTTWHNILLETTTSP